MLKHTYPLLIFIILFVLLPLSSTRFAAYFTFQIIWSHFLVFFQHSMCIAVHCFRFIFSIVGAFSLCFLLSWPFESQQEQHSNPKVCTCTHNAIFKNLDVERHLRRPCAFVRLSTHNRPTFTHTARIQ